MPDEIWTDINGNAAQTQFKGGTKYVRSDKAAPVGDVDLDNAREVFEKWITANGDYPHLKHKSFGGNYLHEEAAMKWDGFKAGYYAQPKQSAPVERIELLENSLSWFDKFIAENGLDENGGLLRIRKAARAYLEASEVGHLDDINVADMGSAK